MQDTVKKKFSELETGEYFMIMPFILMKIKPQVIRLNEDDNTLYFCNSAILKNFPSTDEWVPFSVAPETIVEIPTKTDDNDNKNNETKGE